MSHTLPSLLLIIAYFLVTSFNFIFPILYQYMANKDCRDMLHNESPDVVALLILTLTLTITLTLILILIFTLFLGFLGATSRPSFCIISMLITPRYFLTSVYGASLATC